MTDKYGSLPKVDLEADDVVIIIRPQKKDGAWTGMYDIIQSVVGPTTLSGKEAYIISYTALMMALLPEYLREDEEFDDHYNDYVLSVHEELVAELITKHDLVGDMLQGKLH